MPVRLQPYSEVEPQTVEDAAYEELVRRTAQGWSHCEDETEWLAKLHYLRAGFKAGKVDEATFAEREARLVGAWLRRVINGQVVPSDPSLAGHGGYRRRGQARR